MSSAPLPIVVEICFATGVPLAVPKRKPFAELSVVKPVTSNVPPTVVLPVALNVPLTFVLELMSNTPSSPVFIVVDFLLSPVFALLITIPPALLNVFNPVHVLLAANKSVL